MKQVKYVSLFLLAMVLAVGFASCSDDEEEIQSNELPGLWQCVVEEGYIKYESRPDWDKTWKDVDPTEIDLTYEFKSDGTGVLRYTNVPAYCDWALEDRKLILTNINGSVTNEFKVLKLTSNELIIELFENDTYENGKCEYYRKLTFQKVK